MVLLARMMGEFDQAANYGSRSTFVDGGAGHWAERFVAYAQSRDWTEGVGGNRFGYNERHTVREACVFMLKALGYRARGGVLLFETAYDFAVRLGLVPGQGEGQLGLGGSLSGVDADANILRGQGF